MTEIVRRVTRGLVIMFGFAGFLALVSMPAWSYALLPWWGFVIATVFYVLGLAFVVGCLFEKDAES